MKKAVQITLLLLISVTTFITGTGVTIVSFCCTSCSSQTLFIAQGCSCCTPGQDSSECGEQSHCSQKQHTEIAEELSENPTISTDLHCRASRLSMDIDASSFKPQVACPIVWISDASFIYTKNELPDQSDLFDQYTHFTPPQDIPPREYLSLISILII